MAFTFVDSIPALVNVLDSLGDIETSKPSLFIDLEGNNLSRDGTVSILQMLVRLTNNVYLIDITTLESEAFTTPGSAGQTLKLILESPTIPKAFFDVRTDSDALFGHFGTKLQNVEDIQLMELATRYWYTCWLAGLKKCIWEDAEMELEARWDWSDTKEKGQSLFRDDYGVFDERPLPLEIQTYCIQDVLLLPNLFDVYEKRLGKSKWKRQALLEATQTRINESQGSEYIGRKGRDFMSRGPWHLFPLPKDIGNLRLPLDDDGNERPPTPPRAYANNGTVEERGYSAEWDDDDWNCPIPLVESESECSDASQWMLATGRKAAWPAYVEESSSTSSNDVTNGTEVIHPNSRKLFVHKNYYDILSDEVDEGYE